MLVKKLNVKLILVKIWAYLDDHLEWEELYFLEKENVQCDSEEKQLTIKEKSSSVSFPFSLSSPLFLSKAIKYYLAHPICI